MTRTPPVPDGPDDPTPLHHGRPGHNRTGFVIMAIAAAVALAGLLLLFRPPTGPGRPGQEPAAKKTPGPGPIDDKH